MKFLVTGAAGFIGSHVSHALLSRGDSVVGVDNLNSYYDPTLKDARLSRLLPREGFEFVKLDLMNRDETAALFARSRPDIVVHLAAQAGVRYSMENPHAYTDSNVSGTLTVLEGCRHHSVRHLVYASSSSVYGANTKLPFSVADNVDHPISLYAATKRANELMAYTYSHLYRLPTTGLRFFTVYGPWGRPDMSMFLFTRAILAGEPIRVFNNGQMQRDFTYIDDIVEGVLRVADRPPVDQNPADGKRTAPHRLYNIGNNNPVGLLEMISTLEAALKRVAVRELHPMQPGDVPATYADVADLARDIGFKPVTPLDTGIRRFVAWYNEYYG